MAPVAREVPSARTAGVDAPPQRRPISDRVDDLLSRLSLAERIAMLHQHSPALPALGLRAFRTGTEALHGVAWLGPATVFPQAVGLGATWNPELLERIGEVVGTEVRAKHAADPTVSLNVWAPVVNLLRDPRWGRNEEGYSEDPVLTSAMAVAYCRGLRGDDPEFVRTAPTLKHFLAYNNETDRDRTSSGLRPRVLREYDLPAFRGPLEAGVVDAVMPGYNLVNGRPAHLSPLLAELRTWAAHELLVVSDAQAPSNLVESQAYAPDHESGHAAALRAGVDSFTENGDDPAPTIGRLTRALERGLIDESDVDRAVRRVLEIRLRTGELDPGAGPYAGVGADALHRIEHRDLARRAAREQVVLLKNEGDLLPLSPGARIAVLGPFADRLREDWYSGTMPYRVGIAAGLRAALGASGSATVPDATAGIGSVTAVEGADRVALRVRSTGRYVAVEDLRALVAGGAHPVLVTTGDSGTTPAELFDLQDWGSGVSTLRSALNDRYVTARPGDGRLVADAERPHGWEVHETFTLVRTDDGDALLRHVKLGTYVQVDPRTGALTATAAEPGQAERFDVLVREEGLEQVRRALTGSEIAVVVVGNDPHINGRETQDRTTLALPPEQEALVREVRALQPRTVLVVMSSYPYAVTWADENVPAVLWTSHAGQETGNALADVLLGEHGPSGRLPQTWYREDGDLPDLLDYDVIGSRRTYLYLDRPPLYPFGHGLTYTTFEYGPLTVIRSGETLLAEMEVTNTGSRAAVEVIQIYSRATGSLPDRPVRRFQAHVRVPLEAGARTHVLVPFPLSGLEHWDVSAHEYRLEPGEYEILAGRSSADIRSVATLVLDGAPLPPRRLDRNRVRAVDFDDHSGVTLVDTSREDGDAAGFGRDGGWVLFRSTDLAGAPASFTARVSRSEDGPVRLEVRSGGPDGPLLGSAEVTTTGGRYEWAEVRGSLTLSRADTGSGAGAGAGAVRDICLVATGEMRLDTFRFG